jgi:hypothetical protein
MEQPFGYKILLLITTGITNSDLQAGHQMISAYW